MTEQPENQRSGELESIELPRPMPGLLTSGIVTVGVGLGYMVALFLGGILGLALALPAFGVLLFGLLSVAIGLAKKRNCNGPHRRRYIAVLIAILGLILFLIPGLGSFRVLDLRMRGLVALTGGREELQSWAVEVLARPRERMLEDGGRWRIPDEEWSAQVRRLKPKRVFIQRLFENDREGVSLMYGGGFLHWYIVVGPPGSIPDPKLDENRPASPWFRWADGLYCRFSD